MKMGVTMFISLYATRLVLNALGVDDFGIFNMVAGVIAMLAFLNASMAAATQRFMSYAEGEGDPEKQKIVFNISVVLHLAIAVMVGILLYAAAPILFGHVLNIPVDRVFAARCVYWAMIASTVFGILGVPYEAVLNAHENMLYFAVIGVLESFLKLGAALLVVHVLADKLVLYGVLMAGISILAMTAMLVYCRRNYAECVIAPRRYWKRDVFREMGSFAGWNFTVSASSMLSEYGVGIVLNHFFGVALNAAQAVAQQINGQTMAFSGTMLKALNPVISKSEGAGNRGLMLRASLSGCKFAYLLMAVFAIPLILEAPGLLGLWLHSVPAWAVLFCRLQLARTLLEQLFLSLGSAIYAEGNIRLYTLVKTGSGILFLGATWGFYRMGWPPCMMYVAAILFVTLPGGLLALSICVRRLGLSLRDFSFRVLAPCLVPSAATFAAGILLSRIDASLSPVPVLFRTCSLLVVFLLFLWFFSLDGRERGTLVFFLKSAWRKIQFSK
ncbi:hypothetical protein [Akkermansia massiliensis]|uniref:hypothetical protein n=1 Tax=Akkermansia massiliensis TaxID=2927224 RepID=UPI00202F305D|nr:hypothetical protein [Akkermansia sp. B2-R-115]MCM0685283.1 hypothetical protein [Akkermansia sp. B2-R-115]